MSPPIRFDQMPPDRRQAIQANLAKMQAQKAPDTDIESYLRDVEHVAPAGEPEHQAPQGSLGSRVLSGVGGAARSLMHPIELAKSIGKSALNDLSVIGENMNAGMGQPNENTPAIAKQLPGAMARTATQVAFPGIAGGVAGKLGGGVLAKTAGLATAGGLAGAAQTPDDPIAGALTGGILAPVLGGAAKGVGEMVGGGASRLMDIAGRPMESRPIVKAGPVSIGRIEGLTDRAARLNAPALQRSPTFTNPITSEKPLTPIDATGVAGQRLARGLKTSSPSAETVFRDALEPRAEGAVERVINHGLETTGLVKRESGIQTEQQLHDLAQQQGNEAYGKTFKNEPHPMAKEDHITRLNEIINTPAGQQALKRGVTIAANRREGIGSVQTGGVPEGYSPEQWKDITATMQERGMPVPNVPGGSKQLTPTLQQAHFVKLGFDDLLNSAPEPGSGGSGPHNAAAIRKLKNDWLAVMDEHSPEYQASRKQYADTKQLEAAAKLGQQLFKLHPDQMQIEMRDMPADAQQMVRRTGFNALAERIENGPENIDKGLKNLDRKRMRLLFPDDASFQAFQDGLKQEAQMHATTKGVLSGSTTADKLADMADMAGVSIPDVFRAMKGNPLPLLAKGGKKLLAPRLRANAEALSAERAKLLTAGAGGDQAARSQAMQRMGGGKLLVPPVQRGLPETQDPTLPTVLDQTYQRRPSPSPAAEAVRRQVDDINKRESVRAHRPPQR